MNLYDILPMGAKDATLTAMRWLQSLADAYQSGVLQHGAELTDDEISEVDRELSLFITRVLPRLHGSFGTDSAMKATYHLHCLEEFEEVCHE